MSSAKSKRRVTFEWDEVCQYGGPIWVIVKVNGEPVARVNWINGPPFLSAGAITADKTGKKDDDEEGCE